MKQAVRIVGIAIAVLTLGASAAQAWNVRGHVRCDANGNGVADDGDLPLSGLVVTVNGVSQPYFYWNHTDAAGFYVIPLLDVPASYTISVATPDGATVVSPANPHSFTTTFETGIPVIDFLVNSAACTRQACWLTGGGAKFNPTLGILVAERGPQHSFGGNVNPGCNPDSGEGGNWNHLAHGEKKHFQGTAIQVDQCGNVPGIPEGSESPVTPYNFIEFSGTGVMKGIGGNKTDYGAVSFRARAEDRNEPGSSGAKDGALIDRYFLEVRDGSNAVVLRIAAD